MIWIDSLRYYSHKRKAYAHSIHSKGSFDELIEFYGQLGLKKHWLSKSNTGLWHFDVPSTYYQPALQAGARLVTRKELVLRARQVMSGPPRPRDPLMIRVEAIVPLL